MNDNIKWAAMQPLTGGMYFGTEAAVGHPAEFIISYPGFNDPKFDKEGNVVSAGNEYHLTTYLKNHGRMVPYYKFDRAPFQNDNDMNPTILDADGNVTEHPNFEGLDLVVAVPVCAGLSGATSNATAETKATRNCNMIWLAKYALNTIRPKVYIFENAPRFMSNAGDYVRREVEKIAREAGYTLGYYKTDTQFHDNCQNRPRTFIYFFRVDDENRAGTPQLGFEHLNVSIAEKLAEIPTSATQQVTVPFGTIHRAILAYIPELLGTNWRDNITIGSVIGEIIKANKLDEFDTFIKNSPDFDDKQKAQVSKHVAHIKDKTAQGLGFYAISPVVAQRDGMPSAMFKTMPTVLHYNEDRLYTLREWMHVMGMPDDFEMQGNVLKVFPQIGQNVPARTAQFIASEAVKVINNWDNVERGSKANVVFFDNTKQTTKEMFEL